jgi:hypothetical protein
MVQGLILKCLGFEFRLRVESLGSMVLGSGFRA